MVLSTSAETSSNAQNSGKSKAAIQAWLVDYLSQLLEMDPETIELDCPFDNYGLDSSTIVYMTGELGEWLGSDLDTALLYDYKTIETLSEHLAPAIA